MRSLFLECDAGASGDMMLGALAGLLDEPRDLEKMMADAGIPGVSASVTRESRNGIAGIKVRITVDGVEEGHGKTMPHLTGHNRLENVLGLIDSLNVSDRVRKDATRIYSTIAEAESEVHGVPVDEVHFHEVGALDAVADIVGTCMLVETLGPERIVASPLRTGYGRIECAHGILPVPAPATSVILKGMPIYAGDEAGEFTTPTGAAIVKHFADGYGRAPPMTLEGVGIGFGDMDGGPVLNAVRAFAGESCDILPAMTQLECNIDDMTPEDIADVISILMESGALDASVSPLLMKKGRPGFLLSCMCRSQDRDRIAGVILSNTTTIGIRRRECERYEMSSRIETVSTPYGEVRVKVSEGFGIVKWKPEHDDLVARAAEKGASVEEVRRSIVFDPTAIVRRKIRKNNAHVNIVTTPRKYVY